MTAKRPSRKAKATVPVPVALPLLPEIPATPVKGPLENGKRLGTFERGMSEEMRVNWAEFNGHHFLALRVWHCGLDGVWRPDRHRGCTVKLRELASFSEAVQVAVELATAHG
jgi:hypothetical protein